MTRAAIVEGISVLQAGYGGAATACARLLAQLGAEVHHLRPAPLGAISYDIVVWDQEVSQYDKERLSALFRRLGRVAVEVVSGLNGDSLGDQALAACDHVVGQMLVGAHAAVAALGALRMSRARGIPLSVEVSAIDVLATCSGEALARAACPRAQRAKGLRRGRPSLYVLRCADGYVGLTLANELDRKYAATLAGLDGARIPGNALLPLLRGWTATRTRAEVFHAGQLWRLPIVPVLTPEEALGDEQTAASGVFDPYPTDRPLRGSPFRTMLLSSPVRGIQARSSATATSPLADVRVLDFGMMWAGPYCGRLLWELGAEVVKIEAPARPDGTRITQGQCEGVFSDLNAGKASLVVDLAREEGARVVRRLVDRADVIVENFSPRVMPNFKLGYGAVESENPRVVFLSLPAFGSHGPWAHYVAYGQGIELVAGLVEVSNQHAPKPTPLPYLDYLAGAYGAAGVLAALLSRDRSGHGCRVEVAQREVAFQLLGQSAPSPLPTVALFDPAEARSMLVRSGLLSGMSIKGESCIHLLRPPWRIHDAPARARQGPQTFGGGSRDVLQRLAGLRHAEIESLAADGTILCNP